MVLDVPSTLQSITDGVPQGSVLRSFHTAPHL